MTQTRWTGRCTLSTLPAVLIGAGVIVTLGIPLFMLADGAFTASVGPTVAATVISLAVAVLLVGAGLTFSVVRVQVDDQRVLVTCGPWGHPQWSYRRDELQGVEVTTLSAGRWGGWGWRWNGSGTAVLLRSGPGLRLVPRDGNPFYVTLDDPDAASKALEPASG